MTKPRKFTAEFKAKIALAALRGEATTAELCRKRQLSDTVISRWKVPLVKSAHQVFASTTPDDAQRQRIEDLECLIGQLAAAMPQKTLRYAPLSLDQDGKCERFIRTLKESEVHLNAYTDLADARRRIRNFLEEVYMKKRIHSALEYVTPAEFEAACQKKTKRKSKSR